MSYNLTLCKLGTIYYQFIIAPFQRLVPRHASIPLTLVKDIMETIIIHPISLLLSPNMINSVNLSSINSTLASSINPFVNILSVQITLTLTHTFLIAVILFEMYPLVSLRCYWNNLTTPLNTGYDKKICQLNQKDVPSLRGLHSLCSSIFL